MLESVDQVRFTLAGGSALAATARQFLLGTVLGLGSSALGNENVKGTAADWMLKFKSENIELNYVSLVTCSFSIFMTTSSILMLHFLYLG